ncbi:hypothetical protein TrVE_jg6867 [Triparma verrucosa]|uniref:Uncharacterized protein n=1 Tax=Triparma verrucosa TaxID=1606542 RepID=A0A9W7EVS6_9STRA|nr:hypothetical protein TrVE_jg6867 [Triparma verrucosa]
MIYKLLFAGLGLMEFFNAINCQLDPAGTLGASQGLIGREALAGGAEALASYARVYGWALWGLGSCRIVYATDTKNSTAWLFCFIMHLVEAAFWWSEALTAGGLAAVLQAQGVGAPTSASGVFQVLNALVSAMKDGRTGENVIHHILLFGVPGLTILLLANRPSGTTSGKAKKN